MYIPKHFLNTNDDEAIAFMQKYSFATIISSTDGRSIATHLPFVVQKNENKILISSHFAKANPQADIITDKEVLIIFSEPHAYISPRHYEKEQSVPTWNYISIHVYGKAKVIAEKAQKLELIEKTIINYEQAYQQQWNEFPLEFKEKMLNGIVAFNVEVTEIQASNKLSQNKTLQERQSIIAELANSNNSNELELAEYMRLNSMK